ncbi:MAG TPA: Gfo/Idh/MocA family oxidoreductase [Candidatus Sulfotelmatobacter sp.]|jgi:predicted dehydrogenase|nr:Gfo/Idh/MocA family oxidoreductase [Candidatus Sulfotelmatobacter sp.]
MVRVGLIGFGLAGQAFHAPIIRGVPGMELACILERRTDNAKQRYPEVRIARTLDEMLADKTIGLIAVATPNDSHFSYTEACLEADRDVVVDKPLTPTMRQAEELVSLAEKRGRLMTVYQDRRWDGAFLTVKKLVKSGALGTVAEYEARFDRFRLDAKPGAWREVADFPAAGVLWDLGPHLIDGALVLFGEPETISASALMQRASSQVDDAFDVIMQYPRLRVTLRARIIAYAPSHHLLVHGTQGSFVKYGMDPQEEILRSEHCPDGLDWGKNWGLEPKEKWGTLTRVGEDPQKVETERGDYRGFYANVRDAVEKKAPLDVTPEQFLRTQRTLLLAHKSSREQRVVRWDESVE